MAYGTATLTGTYKTFDDQPASGVVEIIPNSRQLVDAEGDVILAGRVKVTLDEAGSFTVTLPATDDATVEPATGRQYTVVAKLRHTHLAAVTGVELATGVTVDVADVASAPETDALVTPAATTAQLDALEADLTTALATKQDAGDYATTDALTTGLATKADTTAVPTAPEDIGAEPAGLSAATETTLAATYARKERFDIRDYGAVDDEEYFTASITAASSTLTRATGTFTGADVGKRVSIPGAGNSGGVYAWNTEAAHPATITAVNGNEATIDIPAVATASGVEVQMATDCTAQIQAAMDAAGAVEGEVLIPIGRWHAWLLHPPANIDLIGMGHASTIVMSPQDFTTGSTNNGGLIAAYADPNTPYGDDNNRLEGVRVLNLGVDGNLYRHTGDISNRTKGEGINFRWGLRCRVEGCRIWDTPGDGIDFDETKYSFAVGNVIIGAASWGIHHSNGNLGNTIIGNYAENCGHVMALTIAGGQGGFDSGALSTDLAFIGNTAKDNYCNWALSGTGNRVYADGSNKSIDTGSVMLGDGFGAIAPANMEGADTVFTYDVFFEDLVTFSSTTTYNAVMNTYLASASSTARRYRLNGDPADRHNVRANGAHYWGDGSTTGTGDTLLQRTGTNQLGMGSGDSFKVDGTWNGGTILLGNHRLWVDATGALRIKNGVPTSDTDGTVVGTQT